MLDAASAAEIRYVEAARSYGMAEHFLGTWLLARNPQKDAITVGSKWDYTQRAGRPCWKSGDDGLTLGAGPPPVSRRHR
jgi:aryl-alcohol dehydrogenase-like predicted oxidoreductase